MTLLYEAEYEPDFPFEPETLAREVIEGALDFLEFPYEAEIGLTLTDGEGIREANRDFREKDSVTDVLSFPMIEYKTAGDFSDDALFSTAVDPDTEEVVLGDILINIERVRSQAKEYGHSLKREYAFLIVHSILHLCGFDHETPEEEKEMFTKQEAILEGMDICR